MSSIPPWSPPFRRAVAGIVADCLPPAAAVRTRDEVVAAVLDGRGHHIVDEPGADAHVLTAGELGDAGDDAERLLARAADEVRPGGWLAVAVDNDLHASLGGTDRRRRHWKPADIPHLLGGRGIRVEQLWAPGVAAYLAGRPFAVDPQLDREPSLIGAGPVLLAVARTPTGSSERSSVFFATLPRKTVAAAAIVRHPDGGVLIVHDSFKNHWTIPGGVVDADEDPRTAAVRETREEAGLDVHTTGPLGIFHGRFPDRQVFVFAATPVGDVDPRPVHTHEIDGARWVPLEEAYRVVAPHTAAQIRRSLEQPGNLWPQD